MNTDFWKRVLADYTREDNPLYFICSVSPSFETAFNRRYNVIRSLAQRFLDSDAGAAHRTVFTVGTLYLFRSLDPDNLGTRTQHYEVRAAFLNWALKNANDDTTQE